MPRCCKLLFHFGRNVISRVSDQRIYIRVCVFKLCLFNSNDEIMEFRECVPPVSNLFVT